MKQKNIWSKASISSGLCKYLLDAEHTSVFEHVSISIIVTGVSRSWLAQVTRQRMSSPTSGSQHYQDYRDYPMVIQGAVGDLFDDATSEALTFYRELIDEYGVKPEEARQVLPNACAVNFMWTINARSLVEFLNKRMCKRNVEEMRIFADKLYTLCMEWFPELFEHVGPQCKMRGKCKQGAMRSPLCQKKK